MCMCVFTARNEVIFWRHLLAQSASKINRRQRTSANKTAAKLRAIFEAILGVLCSVLNAGGLPSTAVEMSTVCLYVYIKKMYTHTYIRTHTYNIYTAPSKDLTPR